jgi:hypothetical protein
MKPSIPLSALALALSAAQAAATGYNNEAAWQSAVGTSQKETFDGFANLTPVCRLPAVDLYLNRLNTKMHAPTVMTTATTGGTSNSGANVLVNQMQPVLPGLGPIRMFSTKTGQYIKGLGYWNTGGDDSTVLRFYDVNGVLIESSDTGTEAQVFNGIVSDVIVGFVEIDAGSIGNGYFTLDDLQVAFAPIPDGVTLPAPDPEQDDLAASYVVPATFHYGPTACKVTLSGAPGAIGIVYALAGGPLPSPLSAIGALSNSPAAQQVAVVKIGSQGKAAFLFDPARVAPGLPDSAAADTWTLQAIWIQSSGAAERVTTGHPFALVFD